MYSFEKNYWFIIEPYVYCNTIKDELILFNTLDNYILKASNPKIISLVESALSEDSLSVTLLEGRKLKDEIIYNFVKELRDNFLGDVIDTGFSTGKPIQFLPRINSLSYKKQVNKSEERNFADNVLSYLYEVSIQINASKGNSISGSSQFFKQIGYNRSDTNGNSPVNISFEKLQSFLLGIKKSTVGRIRIIGENIWIHPHIERIFELLDQSELFPEVVIDALSINFSLLDKCRCNLIVVVQPIESDNMKDIITKLMDYSIEQFIFIIEEEGHVEIAESICSFLQIENFQFIPFYNGKNIAFFENNVLLEEEDIISSGHTIKSIHSRHLVNTSDFGKLTITADGKVYANPNFPALGTIDDDIRELIYKEMEQGTSWRRIRDMKPCCDCVYQWLCPSPSNYELVIGKSNLCHVKP